MKEMKFTIPMKQWTADNSTGMIYKKEVLEDALQRFHDKVKSNEYGVLGEASHPVEDAHLIELSKVTHTIKDFSYDKDLNCDVTVDVLNSPIDKVIQDMNTVEQGGISMECRVLEMEPDMIDIVTVDFVL